jgi:acetyl esterase/lipase
MTPRAGRTTLILLPALLIINIMTWTGGISAATTVWFPTAAAVHAPAGQTTTLSYCNSVDGRPLAMDITEPSTQATRPAPVVFYIHGGEALQGSRVLEDGSMDGVYFTQLRDNLVHRGFVVGSIDYGLAPLYGVSTEVKEAKCAVRFLRAHANDLGIDPQRIGVYGPSQGGYLSAMLGTTGNEKSLDVGQYLDQSSRVEAVVDMWGPSDLTNFSGSPSWISSLNRGLGASDTVAHAALNKASPLYLVTHDDPPFLIIHGTNDWFIAPHHSQDLAKRLHAAGVPETLVMLQNDGHGLDAPIAGKVEQPDPATVVQMISDFFARTLAA